MSEGVGILEDAKTREGVVIHVARLDGDRRDRGFGSTKSHILCGGRIEGLRGRIGQNKAWTVVELHHKPPLKGRELEELTYSLRAIQGMGGIRSRRQEEGTGRESGGGRHRQGQSVYRARGNKNPG